jgi:hypothetical protein
MTPSSSLLEERLRVVGGLRFERNLVETLVGSDHYSALDPRLRLIIVEPAAIKDVDAVRDQRAMMRSSPRVGVTVTNLALLEGSAVTGGSRSWR